MVLPPPPTAPPLRSRAEQIEELQSEIDDTERNIQNKKSEIQDLQEHADHFDLISRQEDKVKQLSNEVRIKNSLLEKITVLIEEVEVSETFKDEDLVIYKANEPIEYGNILSKLYEHKESIVINLEASEKSLRTAEDLITKAKTETKLEDDFKESYNQYKTVNRHINTLDKKKQEKQEALDKFNRVSRNVSVKKSSEKTPIKSGVGMSIADNTAFLKRQRDGKIRELDVSEVIFRR